MEELAGLERKPERGITILLVVLSALSPFLKHVPASKRPEVHRSRAANMWLRVLGRHAASVGTGAVLLQWVLKGQDFRQCSRGGREVESERGTNPTVALQESLLELSHSRAHCFLRSREKLAHCLLRSRASRVSGVPWQLLYVVVGLCKTAILASPIPTKERY